MTGPWRRAAPWVAGSLAAGVLVLDPAYAAPGVAGPLTSGDTLFPNQGNGGYDVGHYDLDLAWDPGPPGSGGTIDATATISAATTGQPLSSFGLDLQGLTVSSVSVDGAVAAFSRIDEPDGTLPGRHKLVVTPSTPVDGTFTVVVAYGGEPDIRHDTDGSDEGWIPTADGATFMNQPIGSMTGFPNNNTPADKATYTISVDVPAGLEVVSNGEPTLPLPDGSGTRSVWRWTEARPMASELVLVSIGQYEVKQSDVGLSGGRTVPEWSFIDSAIYAADQTSIDDRRAELSSILTGLEARLGPYPGQSTGIVVDQTFVGYALETQDRPTFPSAGSVGGTLVHELTHQWYGDAVSPTVWNDLWINEGMATWAPVDLSGASTYDEFHGEWASTSAASSRWKVPPAGITDPADLFGWQSYDRGAMTYEALRTLIGDPAFRTLIKQWQLLNHGGSHGAADLQALAEQISGLDLDAFFQDWIRDPDKPAWPTPGQPPTDPPPTNPPPQPPTQPAALTIGPGCRVRLEGAARVRHTLTVKVRGCPAGSTYGYRWLAGGTRITGATKRTYQITRGKIGQRIRVEVTVRASGYYNAVRTSKATPKVR
ncbi:MAG TPA: M1 family metallopeptidase [Nocardioides sp.]|uniref:M1 family metallopeptidase n=1 Tax=Nocardioides sp. TaxID=35761 RepID=UPI002E3457CF|nr:M1 family metallopeptidase [Nocardioides sp.]HEX5089583.1 M1 family metallopeptidase [Nocardioides sp.]